MTMRRTRALSIRQLLVTITTALTLMIALFALKDIFSNWVRLANVKMLKDASVLSDQLFDATEKLSIERDVALSMLHAPERDTTDNLRPRLEDSRQGSDDALRTSIAALDRFGFPELSDLIGKIGAHLSVIEGLRPEIDGATTLGIGARDRDLAPRWSAEVTALMLEADNLWTGFVGHFTDVDPIVTQQLWFKHTLRTITDYAGRERSLIGQLIAENADPSPADIVDLQRGQGIVALSWEISRTLAEQSGLYPSIALTYADANSHYATMHDMIQNLFYVPEGRRGATYPIGADLWFELSTQASDSLTSLRAISIRETGAYVDRLIAATEREIVIAGLTFVFALILCVYSFWIVIRRVIRPINRMVDALLSAARGEEVAFTAPAGERDEIGKLAVVLRAFQHSLEDIKRTSAELRRSQTYLRAVVDHAVDGVFTIDADGIVKSFNPACERIFGYAADEMLGRNVTILMPDSEPWETDAYMPRDFGAGDASISASCPELTAKRKHGSLFPIDLSVSAFLLEDGLHFSGIVRDITLRKEAAEELARYTHALERSNKELDDFAYIASHDLKEPLRGIHNHSRFLLEDNENKLDKDSVGRLHRLTYLSQRMERLVNELLYFSRLGRQELAVQATDLNVVVRDIETTLDVFIAERRARIVIPKELPVIVCDKPRVAELFRNLITNGIKYNDKAEKLIEIGHLATKETSGGGLFGNVFYVKDNGRGISPEFHEEIFRIFKRLQGTQDSEEGTGVGLTFVKKIVERHGGRIWLESESGLGTTFYFTLEEQHHDTEHRSTVAA
jgi:PAS domain S-box-containing protein